MHHLRRLHPRWSTPSQERSLLSHVRTSSTDIRVPYVQLAVYILYRVSPKGHMRHAYVSTFLTRMLSYHSQLIRTCP
jgi:hypothetical protein